MIDKIEKLKCDIQTEIDELLGYLTNDDYDEVEKHDCRILIEGYNHILSLLELLTV